MRLISLIILLMIVPVSSIASDLEYCRTLVVIAAAGRDHLDNGGQPDVSKCDCEGTGKSGDGISECQCGPNCDCKKTQPKKEIEVPEESEPLVLSPPKESASVALLESIDDRFSDLVVLMKELRPGSNNVSQGRVIPSRELLYFYTDNCPGCNMVEKEFEKLRANGWRIGSSPNAHIRKIKNGGKQYGVRGYPSFVVLVNGVQETNYRRERLVHSAYDWNDIANLRKGK